MANLCNINGQIVPEADGRVPVLDRGFLFGDSVYEVVRTHADTPLAWIEHWARLQASAAGLMMELDLDEATVARFAIHAPRGEKGAVTAAAGGSSSADVEAFAGQGRVVVDALKVVEALKESVRSELALKMTESKRLVFELVQPRSAARLFWACHPLVPDPLGVASRMKERGIGPKKPSRDAAAR